MAHIIIQMLINSDAKKTERLEEWGVCVCGGGGGGGGLGGNTEH